MTSPFWTPTVTQCVQRGLKFLHLGDYKYWTMTECTDIDLAAADQVLNRSPLYRNRLDFVIRAGDTGTREEQCDEDEPMTEMTESDTLLAHLAWMLSSRHEDIAVEALGYILKSREARRVMEEMLRDGGAEVGPIAHVRTQVSEGQTRPDLVGFDQHGKECVFIEAKFWAELTEQQPTAYLDRLPPHMALLFVAPASRIEPLWAELRQRAGADGPRPASEPAAFKSVTTASSRHLMLTSWAHLLARLEGAGDAQTTIAVQQLRGLTKRMTEEAFHPLQPDDLAPAVPRRLLSLRRLIDDATTRAVKAGYASTSGLLRAPKPTGYGRYLGVAGACAWFGIDFECWAEGSYPNTPLWLHFKEWNAEEWRSLGEIRRALEPLERKAECFDEDGVLYVPIDLPIHVEYDAVLEAVGRRLQEISGLISTGSQTTIAVQPLRGLTEGETEEEFTPLQPNELAPKVPRRLLSLRQLINNATTRADKDEYVSTCGLQVAPRPTGYGRYLYIADAGAWFGIDFECWAWGSYPDTPLWLCFEDWSQGMRRPIGETRRTLEPLKCFDEDGVLYVPIDLPIHVEYGEVLKAVGRRLQEVSGLISAAEVRR